MSNWTAGQKIRRGILAAVCVLLVIVGHTVGVFLALGVLFWYGVVRGGIAIYKGGTRYIARTNAEEIAKKLGTPPLP